MTLNRIKPPPHLKSAGACLWRELKSEYGIVDAAGLTLIGIAAECLDRMKAAQASIKSDGELVTDRYGALKLNPACALEKDARTGMLAAFKALNIDLEPLRDGPGRPAGR